MKSEGEVVAASIDGKALDLSDYDPARDGRLKFWYAALRAEGFNLEVAVRPAGPVALTVREIFYGLPDSPELTIAPRPAGTMPELSHAPDPTVVTRTVRY